jgi:hypothetical protein
MPVLMFPASSLSALPALSPDFVLFTGDHDLRFEFVRLPCESVEVLELAMTDFNNRLAFSLETASLERIRPAERLWTRGAAFAYAVVRI